MTIIFFTFVSTLSLTEGKLNGYDLRLQPVHGSQSVIILNNIEHRIVSCGLSEHSRGLTE